MALHIRLGQQFRPVLTGREEAAADRASVEREIASQAEGTAIALDFTGVKAISVPYVDVFIGGLLSGRLAGFYEEHPLLALNAEPDVRDTIDLVLRARRLSLLYVTGDIALLGGDPVLEQTLKAASRLQRFTATQLAKAMDLSPQAANNRLKALVQRRALTRTRIVPTHGGREFEYAVPDLEDTGSDSHEGAGTSARPARPALTVR